jgi:hypothetical protein
MSEPQRTPVAYRRDLFLARQVIGQLRGQALGTGDVFHVGDRDFDAAWRRAGSWESPARPRSSQAWWKVWERL